MKLVLLSTFVGGVLAQIDDFDPNRELPGRSNPTAGGDVDDVGADAERQLSMRKDKDEESEEVKLTGKKGERLEDRDRYVYTSVDEMDRDRYKRSVHLPYYESGRFVYMPVDEMGRDRYKRRDFPPYDESGGFVSTPVDEMNRDRYKRSVHLPYDESGRFVSMPVDEMDGRYKRSVHLPYDESGRFVYTSVDEMDSHRYKRRDLPRYDDERVRFVYMPVDEKPAQVSWRAVDTADDLYYSRSRHEEPFTPVEATGRKEKSERKRKGDGERQNSDADQSDEVQRRDLPEVPGKEKRSERKRDEEGKKEKTSPKEKTDVVESSQGDKVKHFDGSDADNGAKRRLSLSDPVMV